MMSLRERLASYGVNGLIADTVEQSILEWLSERKLRIVPEEATERMGDVGENSLDASIEDMWRDMVKAAASNTDALRAKEGG